MGVEMGGILCASQSVIQTLCTSFATCIYG